VIGTTFMVLVMMLLSTGVFLWTLSQNTTYNEAVKARNQEEADRRNENVVALGGNYSVSGVNVTVKVMLRNAGSVAVQIINLWVLDTDPSNRRYANMSLNLHLNPGDTFNFVESSPLTVTIHGANASHDFVSWFVTAGGNTISLEEGESVVIAELAQGIGYLAMDFDSFRYFEYDGDDLKDYPTGIPDYNVPHKVDVAFSIILTNLDPQHRTMRLDLYSQMWLYFPAVPGAGPFVWYIVNEVDGNISTPYSDVSIGYGETKLLVFASEQAGGFIKVSLTHPQVLNKLCAVNLCLHGKIGDADYGQNIPFVSLYVF